MGGRISKCLKAINPMQIPPNISSRMNDETAAQGCNLKLGLADIEGWGTGERFEVRDPIVFLSRSPVPLSMTTDPDRIDAYIAKQGLVPLVSDAQWELVLQRIAALFGRELWHRCRLVH
jgi:hypothetical protein